MEPIRERERESWGLESSGIVGGGGGSAWFYMLFEAPREEREINSPALFFFWSVREKDERKDEVCLRPRTIYYSLFIFRKLPPKVGKKRQFDFSDFGTK